MPPAGPEGQFRFLISCIRYSNNGKVDFSEVARECNIVSKGAAAKRYERMMKAHGIHQTQTTIRDTPIPSRRRKEGSTCAGGKKRKLDQFDEDTNQAADDDEGLGKVKEEVTGPVIKNETTASTEEIADLQYPWAYYRPRESSTSLKLDEHDEHDVFNSFTHAEDFAQLNTPSALGGDMIQNDGNEMGDEPSSGHENSAYENSSYENGTHESILISD